MVCTVAQLVRALDCIEECGGSNPSGASNQKQTLMTKTWKIGESCQGGIITVEIKGKIVSIIGKEWDFSTGSRRSSDQRNAKEFTRSTIDSTEANAYYKIYDFLVDLSTSYYADEVIKWVATKIRINQTMW